MGHLSLIKRYFLIISFSGTFELDSSLICSWRPYCPSPFGDQGGGHLIICIDVFGFHNLEEGCYSHLVEARDAAKYPTTEKTELWSCNKSTKGRWFLKLIIYVETAFYVKKKLLLNIVKLLTFRICSMQPKIIWFKMSVVSRMTSLEINHMTHF